MSFEPAGFWERLRERGSQPALPSAGETGLQWRSRLTPGRGQQGWDVLSAFIQGPGNPSEGAVESVCHSRKMAE